VTRGQATQLVGIINKKGLHARASAAFAKLAGKYASKTVVRYDGLEVDATHIMDLLMLAAHKGAVIEIHAEGADADEAITALASLVADGFGELARDNAEPPERGY